MIKQHYIVYNQPYTLELTHTNSSSWACLLFPLALKGGGGLELLQSQILPLYVSAAFHLPVFSRTKAGCLIKDLLHSHAPSTENRFFNVVFRAVSLHTSAL